MKTKKELNYRKQNDDYKNRHINCENCKNILVLSPYKNRCMLMDTDIKNRKLAIQTNGVCDSFSALAGN